MGPPEPVRYLIQAEAGYAKRAEIALGMELRIYASYVEGVHVGYGRVSACRHGRGDSARPGEGRQR